MSRQVRRLDSCHRANLLSCYSSMALNTRPVIELCLSFDYRAGKVMSFQRNPQFLRQKPLMQTINTLSTHRVALMKSYFPPSLPGVCPVLCSGHGSYGGGRCHCEAGWSGIECDQPSSELDGRSSGNGFVISCSIPCSVYGTCVNGRCQCDAEHTGASCETRES